MVITIDGPAGTGKSSVARHVADRLRFDFLDTGAMYRAIALAAVRRQSDLDDPRELEFVARHARIEFDWSAHPPAVLLNDEPVGHLLRSAEVTAAASQIAVVAAIRRQLVDQQRKIGQNRCRLVTEGRDQGSVVFPDAQLKIYLDADPAERGRRRVAQLRARGEVVDPAEILRQIVERDQRDSGRSTGPLAVASDAKVIDTTHLTQQQVIDSIVQMAREQLRGVT
ncbi:MAG: (d)CMP kinase [Phycisphaerales bacterium]|nr:(d)CMP kinase [Phycisphaerales bacterium]